MSSSAGPGVSTSVSSGETYPARSADSLAMGWGRSPLQLLLHALNQPLTGLQCAMEVALAKPRTVEQYIQGLREGLGLTERMRALVEAIREVADAGAEEEERDEQETAALKTILREVVDDLKPVAEAKRVCIALDVSGASSLLVRLGRRRLLTLAFRVVESALSLADRGSALRIETGSVVNLAADEVWVRIRWYAGPRGAEFSRPELGLLVAQAGWERAGAKWERKRMENLETVTIRVSGVPAGESK
jgi:hypothetical protein